MRVLFSLQIFSETFIILRRSKGNNIINIIRYSYNAPIICVRFEWNLKYSRQSFENIEIKNLMKIRPIEVVFHADGYGETKSHFLQFYETA